VLLIDLDPQAHLTLHLGADPARLHRNMYDVMTGRASLREATIEVSPHLSLVASTIDLAAAEIELVGTVGREQILRDSLRRDAPDCRFVLIDCPPSLGLLTLNALAAADEVLIPLQPHFLALQGLGKLLETVALVRTRINPSLVVSGVILCMYETTTRLAGEVVADLKSFFEHARGMQTPWSNVRIYETVIRRNVKLAECPSHGKTIFQYAPNCHGADDYRALADEFLRQYIGTCASDEQPGSGESQTPTPNGQGPDAQAPQDSPSPPCDVQPAPAPEPQQS